MTAFASNCMSLYTNMLILICIKKSIWALAGTQTHAKVRGRASSGSSDISVYTKIFEDCSRCHIIVCVREGEGNNWMHSSKFTMSYVLIRLRCIIS